MKKETTKKVEKNKNQHTNIDPYKVFIYLMLFVSLSILLSSIYTIPTGHRGVLITLGKPNMEVKEEGVHLRIPFIQTVERLEVRKQKIEVDADSASKDLQDVQTRVAINFHLDEQKVPLLYQKIGKEYRGRIIDPAIQECIKSVTAKYEAEELITQRTETREKMMELLKNKLSKYNIIVDDFNIVNFQFSEEFDKAIEAKVTAEQLKLKAEMDLMRIEVEARQVEAKAIGQRQAKIAKAEAESEAIRLVEEQLSKSPRYIEWYTIEKWNGILPKVTSGVPLIGIDITD